MVLVVVKMMVIALSDDNGDVCVVSEGNRVGGGENNDGAGGFADKVVVFVKAIGDGGVG